MFCCLVLKTLLTTLGQLLFVCLESFLSNCKLSWNTPLVECGNTPSQFTNTRPPLTPGNSPGSVRINSKIDLTVTSADVLKQENIDNPPTPPHKILQILPKVLIDLPCDIVNDAPEAAKEAAPFVCGNVAAKGNTISGLRYFAGYTSSSVLVDKIGSKKELLPEHNMDDYVKKVDVAESQRILELKIARLEAQQAMLLQQSSAYVEITEVTKKTKIWAANHEETKQDIE